MWIYIHVYYFGVNPEPKLNFTNFYQIKNHVTLEFWRLLQWHKRVEIGQKSIPIMNKNIIVSIGGSKVKHILWKLTFKVHEPMEYDMIYFLKAYDVFTFLKTYFHWLFFIWFYCPILYKVNIKYSHDLSFFKIILMVPSKNVSNMFYHVTNMICIFKKRFLALETYLRKNLLFKGLTLS
jgi:hypothetical protein